MKSGSQIRKDAVAKTSHFSCSHVSVQMVRERIKSIHEPASDQELPEPLKDLLLRLDEK